MAGANVQMEQCAVPLAAAATRRNGHAVFGVFYVIKVLSLVFRYRFLPSSSQPGSTASSVVSCELATSLRLPLDRWQRAFISI